MAEITKPSTLPRFADGTNAQVLEPSEGKKDIGWIDEKPPHQIFNWIHKMTYLWIQWLSEKLDKMLGTNADTTLTIASGVIIPTQGNHKVANEGGLKHDTLTNISIVNMDEGRLLVLRPATASRRTVIQHNAGGDGSIMTRSGCDIDLQRLYDQIIFRRQGNYWYEISRTPAREYTFGRIANVPLAQYSLQIPRYVSNGASFMPTGAGGIAQMAYDGEYVYYGEMNKLKRFNPRNPFPGGVVEEFTLPWPSLGSVYGLLWDGTKIYISGQDNTGSGNFGLLLEFDTVTLTASILRTFAIDELIYYMCFDGEYIIATGVDTTFTAGKVMRINPNTGATVNEVTTNPVGQLQKLCFDGTWIWGASRGSGKVMRFTPDLSSANTVNLTVTYTISGIAFDGAFVWALGENSTATGEAYKINPSDLTFTIITGMERPEDICFDGNWLWSIGLNFGHGITKIDPLTNAKTVVPLPGRTTSAGSFVVFDGREVWTHDGQLFHRICAR